VRFPCDDSIQFIGKRSRQLLTPSLALIASVVPANVSSILDANASKDQLA